MPDSHASLSMQLKGARCITTGSLKYHTWPGFAVVLAVPLYNLDPQIMMK